MEYMNEPKQVTLTPEQIAEVLRVITELKVSDLSNDQAMVLKSAIDEFKRAKS